MIEVKTLVYFDLEATGFKSSGRPRISELSLIAVNVHDVLQMNKEMTENMEHRTIESCVHQTSDITGLDNYNLTGQSKFSKSTGDLINNFLSLLPAPVCLVAHNGNAYDFPLVKAELEKAGTQLKSDVFCIDSYVGIRQLLKKEEDIINVENETVTAVKLAEEHNNAKLELDAISDLINTGVFEIEMEEGICTEFPLSKAKNEETPKSARHKPDICLPPKKRKHFLGSEIVTSRKALNFENLKEPKSFSLINLHRYLLGYSPEQSHGAEADCLSLMKTTAALGDRWTDWVKENCSKFETFKKMWG